MQQKLRENQHFLDKFRGKTNKVDKTGLNHVLESSQNSQIQKYQSQKNRKKQRSNNDNNQYSEDYGMKKIDLDELIPSNPEARGSKYSAGRKPNLIKSPQKKMEYVPSAYSPKINEKYTIGEQKHPPPSRSISDTVQERQKYIFGKYLKLDNQAMKYFDFLNQLDSKKTERKSKYSQGAFSGR